MLGGLGASRSIRRAPLPASCARATPRACLPGGPVARRSPGHDRSPSRRVRPRRPRLDALGDRLEAEVVGEADQAADDRIVRRRRVPSPCTKLASILASESGSIRSAASDDARPKSSSESLTPCFVSRSSTFRSSSAPAPGPDGTTSRVSRCGLTPVVSRSPRMPSASSASSIVRYGHVDRDADRTASCGPAYGHRRAPPRPRAGSAPGSAACARRAGRTRPARATLAQGGCGGRAPRRPEPRRSGRRARAGSGRPPRSA